ncbi:MAG: eukaryotic-like serine/threonine-protein kinase [Solirubrobacteraceae bacterium]|jgi:serine/threonine-protein kinase|nr:eukaryotic-like serine/threonine-protein kinase [Solirubrobacteraceae bacterium]
MATQVLAERYELGERLGVGGMSTVLAAFDRRLERPVAVKLLAEHLADDSQFVARFRREALSAARLVHPNVVQVFDFGLDQQSGRHYIVMELITGQSGAEILRDEGVLGVQEALSMVLQACRGLDYAHRNGVVHRDVKPGNLLRAEDGVVKLADFGIAKALSDESAITQVGSVIGTAAYLAPEQAAGEEVGPPADLYALGVVTYQFLSGRLPYEAQSLTELALKQMREIPPPLDELNPEVTPQLAVAVDRALALDPRERYPDAESFRDALTDGARGVGPTEITRAVASPTEATRALRPTTERTSVARPPQTAARQPRAPRQPRPGAAGPPTGPATVLPAAGGAAREAGAARRRRGRWRRTLLTLFVLLLLGGGAIAAVVATSNSSNAVRLRNVVYDQVNQAVDQMQQLIDDNTR